MTSLQQNSPRVSIGLPVYNGENFLRQALESILAQTYVDFEIIISDNASTDTTEQICREYLAREPRIQYYRSDKNLGAAANFNRAFELSHGEYFKWAAHDDTLAPEFLSRCVQVLDQDPSVVLVYSKAKNMNKDGVLRQECPRPEADSFEPQRRFRNLLDIRSCYPIFGLIRSSSLKTTTLHGAYPGSDKILLARLSLLGRLYEVPEYLFFRRVHPNKSVRAYPAYHLRAGWFDPAKEGHIVFPRFRLCKEYFVAIKETPLSDHDRVSCYLQLLRKFRWFGLSKDLVIAAAQILRLDGFLTF